jgi:hypothetical protein
MHYLKIIRSSDDIDVHPVHAQLEGTRFILSHPSVKTVKTVFHILTTASAVSAAARRWVSMSLGGDIYVRPNEIKSLTTVDDNACVRFTPGWPCDCEFEVSGISAEFAKVLESWAALS